MTTSAVDLVLDRDGYILDDGSPLALQAESVWNEWWKNQSGISITEARDRILGALDAPRPQLSSHLAHSDSSFKNMADAFAWMRPVDLVTVNDGAPFPSHHTVEEMANYLSSWTEDQADSDLRNAYWDLIRRPGGWASKVSVNGNHRSLLAQAAGIPVVRVKLTAIRSWTGDQYLFCHTNSVRVIVDRKDPIQAKILVNEKSWSFKMVKRYVRAGLCTYTGYKISGNGNGEIYHLQDMHPILPWIMSSHKKESRIKFEEFCRRFGDVPGLNISKA